MNKNNNKNVNNPDTPETDSQTFGVPKEITLPDKAFLILDSAVEAIEKNIKSAKTQSIVDKAKNSTPVSKPKGKVSEEKTEITLNKDDLEIIPDTELKEQYINGISAVLILINPILTLKGIEPIKDSEIRDLVYAIFDIFEPNLKKAIAKAEVNISFIKNIRKLLNLGKAVWNLIAPRLQRIRNILTENKAKREVLKLNQLAKQKNKPTDNSEIHSNIITAKDDD